MEEEKKRINLDDLRDLFSQEEIEARKKEILEANALRRKKDFEAKELMKQERQALADKGWINSKVGQEVRIMEDADGVIAEILEIPVEDIPKGLEMIELEEEPPTPKEAILKKVEEQLPDPEKEADRLIEEDKAEKEMELDNLVECPECKGFFRKGGAFANHYKTHFNGE